MTRPPSPTTEADPSHHLSGYPCTVLIVDSDPESAAAAMAVLEADGCMVFPVASLATAVHLLSVLVVGVILADLAPSEEEDVQGYTDLVQGAGGVPVILFTARPIKPEAARAAGFAGVVHKPYDAETLLAAVREGARRAAEYWAPPRRAPRGTNTSSRS